MGTLNNRFLAKEMMLAYFADNGKEISPKVSLCEKPVKLSN